MTPKRTTRGYSFASRLFGYDIFISYALGTPPCGTLSYASDLARRLRERDFTVFFSEDEAPSGNQLDSTLRFQIEFAADWHWQMSLEIWAILSQPSRGMPGQ